MGCFLRWVNNGLTPPRHRRLLTSNFADACLLLPYLVSPKTGHIRAGPAIKRRMFTEVLSRELLILRNLNFGSSDPSTSVDVPKKKRYENYGVRGMYNWTQLD